MESLFKLGLVSISFRALSVEELVRMVSDAGLQGIEWGGDVHVPHGDLVVAGRVRRVCKEAGLEISAYGSYYKHGDCLSLKGNGPDFEAVLDSAEALGASMIRVWAGETGSNESSEDWPNRVVARTREIAELSAKRGISIGFEFHDHSLTDTIESTINLLKQIDRPNVTTFWQTPLGIPHVERLDGLKKVVGNVSNIHCNYFGDNMWPGMRLLEEGAADWKDYLDVLEESGKSRWISIEHVKDHHVSNFPRDAATLKSWIDERSG